MTNYNLGNRVIGLYEINVPTAASIMQANNIYVYCGNNPVIRYDPSGLRTNTVIVFFDEHAKQVIEYIVVKMNSVVEKHYNRNEQNIEIPLTETEAKKGGWTIEPKDSCHQFTAENSDNVKYIKDGVYEAVYNSEGNLVTSDEDIGTYNFADPNDEPLRHFVYDVFPWIVLGNSNEDDTEWHERAMAFFGGIETLFE